MAKQSSVNLDITNNPDGFDISGGTTLRKLSVTGGDVTIAGSGSATVTFPTTSTTIAGLGIAQTFTATQTFSAGISASGATFSGNISAPNIVNSLNGFTGAVQVTGSGAILQTVSGTTTTFGARLSTATVTGVASFDPVFFSVGTTGHIRLAAAYQATGSDSATVPLATTSLTGTASFNPNRFQVSATGNVDLLAAFQVTGQTVVSGGPSQLVSTSGNTVTIDNRVASTSVTGVAAFNATRFTVSAAGAVDLASAFQVTGDTIQAGSFINIGAGKTINNIGVQTLNGATGAITNVAKTNVDNNFSSAQTIDGAGAYLEIVGALGDAFTLTPGVGIVVSDAYNSPQTLRFSQTGVTTTVTLPSYTTTLAGLSGNQTFTGLNSFNAGISASALTVAGGATFSGNVFLGDLPTGVTADSNDFVRILNAGANNYRSGIYRSYKTLAGATSGVVCTTPADSGSNTVNTFEVTLEYYQTGFVPAVAVHKFWVVVTYTSFGTISSFDYTESIVKGASTTLVPFTISVEPTLGYSLNITAAAPANTGKFSGWAFLTTVRVY